MSIRDRIRWIPANNAISLKQVFAKRHRWSLITKKKTKKKTDFAPVEWCTIAAIHPRRLALSRQIARVEEKMFDWKRTGSRQVLLYCCRPKRPKGTSKEALFKADLAHIIEYQYINKNVKEKANHSANRKIVRRCANASSSNTFLCVYIITCIAALISLAPVCVGRD